MGGRLRIHILQMSLARYRNIGPFRDLRSGRHSARSDMLRMHMMGSEIANLSSDRSRE